MDNISPEILNVKHNTYRTKLERVNRNVNMSTDHTRILNVDVNPVESRTRKTDIMSVNMSQKGTYTFGLYRRYVSSLSSVATTIGRSQNKYISWFRQD